MFYFVPCLCAKFTYNCRLLIYHQSAHRSFFFMVDILIIYSFPNETKLWLLVDLIVHHKYKMVVVLLPSNLPIYNYEPLMKRDEDLCHNRGCAPDQSILSVYSTCLGFVNWYVYILTN